MAKHTTKQIWLSNSIFAWQSEPSAPTLNSSEVWQRSYELWQHAERRLVLAASDDDRADVIAILRRVLNHRLGKLRSLYFQNLKLITKPSGVIEQLEYFGIAKRVMVHKLLQIRNQIEYKDRKPPRKDACAELSEFVWYFLRSTDIYIAKIYKGFYFTKHDNVGGETAYNFPLFLGPKIRWKNLLTGWFSPDDVSISPVPNWLRVEAKYAYLCKDLPKRSRLSEYKDNDWFIVGRLAQEPKQIEMLCRFYFAQPKDR